MANRRSSSRQAVQLTSTPCVSTVRASPDAGSISSNSPATIMRSLQTASITAACVPAGDPQVQPSCTSLRRSVRALRATGSIRASSELYQALSPAPSETIATTARSPHQVASQTFRSTGEAGVSSSLATSST